ncbi:DMT family transporter [Paenibacillus sp. 481]|uniref:DMT family transporter n=1 Tax=Paenibacillus sp. 481 TaxID=2835869 RepID=UPI001E3DD37C|nr:multidrug efflux SMR transporter [Paenibacillus sp. 481]UHA75513.1 multidrug efflux SMR transporter [Paenibacillus sp. 481]
MAWLYLIVAGLFEIVGVIGIKRTAQHNSWLNNAILFGGFFISFKFLLAAMETIPLSTAYAVWTGIGTVGSALVGIMFYKEPKGIMRIMCVFGIIAAVISLKLVS